MSDNNQGAGIDPENIQQSQNQDQGQQGGYDSIRQSQGETEDNMGGGYGSHGSGVAGGYEGSNNQQSTQEKQDWLDKGISSVGQKLGVNIVSYFYRSAQYGW